jgi:hypothetical protein
VAVEVVVVAFAFDAHQQELAVFGITLIVVVVLQQFEGMAGFHGSAVARAFVGGAVDVLVKGSCKSRNSRRRSAYSGFSDGNAEDG